MTQYKFYLLGSYLAQTTLFYIIHRILWVFIVVFIFVDVFIPFDFLFPATNNSLILKLFGTKKMLFSLS